MVQAGTSVGATGQLGIPPGDFAAQRIENGRLVMEFVRPPEPQMRSLAGILGPSPAGPVDPLDIDEAVSLGITEEWRRTASSGPTP
jgi:hypothetical protein